MNCRFCNTPLEHIFIDLVNAPPSNSFLRPEQLDQPEVFYPLKLYVCHECFLVQIDEFKCCKDIFTSDYVYFSSYSNTWVEHSRCYADAMTTRLSLDSGSLVIEIASNDGYLLQFFKNKDIPCLGIEPATATAEVARAKGIEVLTDFFGESLGRTLKQHNRQADLLIGNNVLAHVPDINDFVAGLRHALATNGVVTMEFPHLMRLVQDNQFDTIYHEHFSYLSLNTVRRIFCAHSLTIFDVEELPTHGGSLRIFATHAKNHPPPSLAVRNLISRERDAGMLTLQYYQDFQARADKVKCDLLEFLIRQKRLGKRVAGYGAAAKGNTLLNYCGLKKDLIMMIADVSEHKQGLFTPGSHIPVLPVAAIFVEKPDFILILPWNIKEEIMHQLRDIRHWGARFVVPVPELDVI